MSKERLEALASLERDLIELEAKEEIVDPQSVDERLRNLEITLRGDEDLDGKVEIFISPDKTRAYLLLTQNKIGGKPVTYEKIIEALIDKEIKEIDAEAIEEALKEDRFGQEILVAEGVVPEKGKDGFFTYLFKTSTQEILEERKEPKIVDEKVFAGQILAVRVAATEGKKSGLSVTGEELPPQRGDEIKIEAGDGVGLSDDGLTAYATKNGNVKWLKNSVCVEGEEAHLEITPSVVIATGLNQTKEEGAQILNLSLEEIEAVEIGPDEFRIFPKEATHRPWEESTGEKGLEMELLGELGQKKAEGEKEGSSQEGEPPLEEVEEVVNGLAMIEITPDGKKANMTLIPPQGGGLPVTFEDCLTALRENGIRCGIKEDKIKEAIKENIFYVPLLVACEVPAEPGTDAQIEYKFDIAEKIRFKEDERGKINLRQLNLIQNVEADDLLAVKIPAKRGERPGVSLSGEQIPPSFGKDIGLPAGINTKISEDGFELRAIIAGRVLFRGGKVEVEPIYEIKGDVGFATGNIDFVGSVIIGGNVKEGFRVEADGNIEVSGLVAKGAFLNSEKDVIVGGGVIGGYIEAKGDITVKFSDSSILRAGGDINIMGESLHSFLNANKNIFVLGGKKSVIVGGIIRAVDEIRAEEIGNRLNIETKVEVGAEPWVREQLEETEDKIAKDTKRIKEEILNLETLRSRGSQIKDGYKKLVKILKKKRILDLSLKSTRERKEILAAKITRLKTGKISANVVYPGVLVKIRETTMEIKKPLEEVSLWFEGGEIKVEKYKVGSK